MFVHGGFGLNVTNSYGVLADWSLFDIGLCSWVPLSVTTTRGTPFSLLRKMHTLTPNISYANAPGVEKEILNTRLAWCNNIDELSDVKGIEKRQAGVVGRRNRQVQDSSSYDGSVSKAGFYLFGGQDN